MSNIETIAKEAGVSIATVSRTLRNPNSLKTDNQRRTIDVAKQLGYDFNKRKKRVLSRKTKQIVFLSFSKTLSPESFYQEGTYLPIVNGINQVIEKEGYNLIVSDVGVDEKPPPSLSRNDVDGVIFHGRMSRDFFKKYIKHIPHVGIQHYDPRLRCSWIMTDKWSIAFRSLEYLYELGHRRIAFLSDMAESFHGQELYRGYKDGLACFNLPFEEVLVQNWQRPRINGIIPLETELPDYTQQVEQFLNCEFPATAIICSGIFRAKATIHALEKMGLSVPENISVIGSHSELSKTSITGFRSSLGAVCSYAAQFLMELINGKHERNIKVMLQPIFSAGTSAKALGNNNIK